MIIISADQKELLETVLLGRGESSYFVSQDERRLVIFVCHDDCLGGDDLCRAQKK